MTRRACKMFIRSCTLILSPEDLTKRKFFTFTLKPNFNTYRYARIAGRIFQNPNLAQRRTAQKLLGWISFSKRPLKWHEIQGATSIDIQDRTVNFEGRQM